MLKLTNDIKSILFFVNTFPGSFSSRRKMLYSSPFKNKILFFALLCFLQLVFSDEKTVVKLEIGNQPETDRPEIKDEDLLKKYIELNPIKDTYFNKRKKQRRVRKIEKEFKSLTLDELELNKNIEVKNLNKETAARYVERMLSICKDQQKIRELRLELADLYYDLQYLDKASKIYLEYIKLYPGNINSEYAYFRAINSLFLKTLIPERDQADTKDTVKLAKAFLEKESYKKYRDQVIIILDQSNKKLLLSEINIFNFYLKRKKIKASEGRLAYIKEHYLKNPKNESEKSLLLDLEEQLNALKENRRYVPNYQKKYEEARAKAKSKRPYTERF